MMAHDSGDDPRRSTVLVTGGSGFIGGHCILALLERGHAVRATLRSLDREAAVRQSLSRAGAPGDADLTFVAADLTSDVGWAAAVADSAYVLHVASPVHPGPVASEGELIEPAREGTLRVLRAAQDAGVRRVVLTSAFHAVSWGHPRSDHVFTEADWTILDGPGVDAYGASKTLAERAAWDFVAGGSLELVTTLPVAVMGPILGSEVSGANHVVQRILRGQLPGYPDLWFPIVDVRDVAAAHVVAMTAPDAAGQRLLLGSDPAISMQQIGAILRSSLGDDARRVPTRSIPSVVVRLAALFSPEFRGVVPELGYAKRFSTARAERVLDWRPRPSADAVVAAAESLLRHPV